MANTQNAQKFRRIALNIINKQKKRIKTLKSSKARFSVKVHNMKSLLQHLKNQKLISENAEGVVRVSLKLSVNVNIVWALIDLKLFRKKFWNS